MNSLHLGIILTVGLLASAISARSDIFGRNPQHDFGSVTGRRVNAILPFWTMSGDAFANEDFVRLTPDRQSKRGGVWNSQKMAWSSFELMLKFNINGVSNVGADGFGWWLVEEATQVGNFFGFVEKFNGIGVVVDTYDNDNTGTHPMITVLKNDGTKTYEHSHEDGEHHASSMEIGHCSIPNVRNKGQHTVLKIALEDGELTVSYKNENEEEFHTCVEVPDVILSNRDHYMGLTATTGDLADNHDIYGITLRNLENEARYFDSEARFAQFSKYTISESLGRIQADLRKALDGGSNVGEAGSKKKDQGASLPSTAKAFEAGSALAVDLSDIRTEIMKLSDRIATMNSAEKRPRTDSQQADPRIAVADEVSKKAFEKAAGQLQDVTGSLNEHARSLGSIKSELQKEIRSMSGDRSQTTAVVTKLQRLVESLERLENRKDSNEEGGGVFSTIFNIVFGVVVLIALYLAFALYRNRVENNRMKFV